MKKQEEEAEYVLKLFVTGMSGRSIKAISNIKSICEEYLLNRYKLEIIDIYKLPDSMYENDLIASPTLIKKKPSPVQRIIGDLEDRKKVLLELNIKSK